MKCLFLYFATDVPYQVTAACPKLYMSMTSSTVTIAQSDGTPVEVSLLTSPYRLYRYQQANPTDNPTLIVTLTGSTETPSVTDVTFYVQGPLSHVIITVGTAPNAVIQVSASSKFSHHDK